jgi:hypothetical protein
MIKDLQNAKDKVENILAQFPQARDCDKTLWLAYLVMYCDLRKELGEEPYAKFKSILLDKETCTMESVRRTRQKFQQDGKYMGTKRLAKMQEAEFVSEWTKA